MSGTMSTAGLPPSLQRVMRGDTCSNCGACAGIAPGVRLTRSPEGWWRPAADPAGPPVDAALDARLAAICPGSTVAPWQEAPNRHPLWGPYHRCLTGWSTDSEIRHTASSGGMLSSLALFALGTGMVDRVLHVGMDPDSPLLTAIRRSSGRESVLRGAGSRYGPAAPLATLNAELAEPGRLLFIGKPCDAGALRQLCRIDPAIAERVPVILSFYCGATPSQDATTRLVRSMDAEPEHVTAFRYRGDGWPGFATAKMDDGSERRRSYAESWGDVLSKDVQLRCKICPDAVGGVADVAAGDAWYPAPDGYPSFDEAEGRSLVMTRTATGDALVAAAERAGAIETQPLDIGEIIKMQGSQGRRKRLVGGRVATLRAAGRPMPVMRGLDVLKATRQAGLLEQARNVAGLARRLLLGRI